MTALSEPPVAESRIHFETDDALPLRKKPGRKPNPHVEEQKMRRKEQNREAQRHHRERKERYVLELERRIDELAAQVRSLGGEPIPERPELVESRPPPKKCIMRGSSRTKNEEDSEDDDEPAQNAYVKSKSVRGRAGSLSKSSPEGSSVADYYSSGSFQASQAWAEDQKLGLASRTSNGTLTSQADTLLLESMLASPHYLQYQVPDRTQMGFNPASLQTIVTNSNSPVNQQPSPLSSIFPGLSPISHPPHPTVQGTTSSPPQTTPNGLAGSALTIPVSDTPSTFNGLTATPSPFPVFMHFSEHILASNGISTAPILSDDPVFMEAMMRELLGENFDGGACAVQPQPQMQTQTQAEPEPVAAFCGRSVLGPDGKSTRFSRCLDSLPSPEVQEHLIALKKLGIVDVDELCEDLRAKARCRGNPLDWRNWRVPKGFYDKWVVLKGINGIPEDDF
ncbi:hypothetical protein M427DRAFT_58905 [Gonapodya prolifera JEL478]|uniref:BZIP domain-containing protein n=1 Tax=Gonapodya prolifera (strain JEL478) TaxID=1344416 RepID=A0A139A951_GONPJ|nr:hypothetical protein M427DRAFT_58905 [Gonapodya prolifera JEL478]|eukprot:KXS13189.1 hypothetical protein M427DRAFT_58905 [Gonapodya prolifera JEL478]